MSKQVLYWLVWPIKQTDGTIIDSCLSRGFNMDHRS